MEKNNKKIIEYLDKILSWFATDIDNFKPGDFTPRRYVSAGAMFNSLIKKYPELNTNHFSYYYELLLEKMALDGYLDKEPNKVHKQDPFRFCYSITINGILFEQKGGYEGEIKRERAEKISNLPKKYWYIAAILGFLIGMFGDAAKEYIKLKYIQPLTIKEAPLNK